MLRAFRRGRCLGSEEFKQHKLEELDGQVGQHHFGQLRFGVAQAKGERIIGEELRRLGWQEANLAARRKRDPNKLAIARPLVESKPPPPGCSPVVAPSVRRSPAAATAPAAGPGSLALAVGPPR